MTVRQSSSSTDAIIARMTAVIEAQQREIERLRAGEARRRLVQLAEGVLIEQMGCPPAEATAHLRRLAERAGADEVELAADLLGVTVPEQGPQKRTRVAVTESAAEVARDGSELASALLGEALRDTGAVAVALWQLRQDGALELTGHAGFDPLDASRWRRIPPQMDALPQRAVRTARPLWLGTTAGLSVPLFGHWPGGARAVLPLSGAKTLVGVMETAWPSKRDGFGEALRRELATVARIGARAVDFHPAFGEPMRQEEAEAALVGCGLLARPRRDEAGNVIDFEITHVGEHLWDPAGREPREIVGRGLVQAYPWLGATEAFDRAVEVLETGAPCWLDRLPCTALSWDAVAPAVTSRVRIVRYFDGVLIDWRIDNDAERLAALLRSMQRLGQIGGWVHDLVTGETTWTRKTFALFGLPDSAAPVGPFDLRRYVHPSDAGKLTAFQDTLRSGEDAGAAFRIVRPDGALRQIRARGEPVVSEAGRLIALRGIYQDISAQYESQVALAATRDRLADTEQEVRQQHRIALELQQVILPSSARPPQVDGLEIAVRYRPAEQEHKVGGDWYDVVTLPGGRVLLVIGDVAGHGLAAATGMVAMRNMLRGLSATGAGPARLLTWLNATAFHLARGTTGTVLCGLYEPGRQVLRWARAGHLPPLLVRGAGAEFLPLPKGVLLGAIPDAEFEEVDTELRSGDMLVLYTDGLIERRSVLIDDSLDRLARSATLLRGDIERITDELLHHASADTDDDTCLIVIRLGSPGIPAAGSGRVCSGP